MFNKIMDSIEKAVERHDQRMNELLTKYKEGDYIKIKHTDEIREFHYGAPKGTMRVINEQKIYISLGDYKWERYMYYNNKLHRIDHRHADGEYETHHTFTPNRRAVKTIENKNDMLLTKEERDALDYYKSNMLMNIIVILFYIGMAIYYLNKM